MAAWIVLLVCMVFLPMLDAEKFGLLDLLCYPCIAVILACFYVLVRRHLTHRIQWPAWVAAWCVLAVWWASRDTTHVKWSQDDVHFIDTRMRFTGTPLYRSSYTKEGDSLLFTEGPLDSAGMPHGHWRMYSHLPPLDLQIYFIHGTKVTAEEWLAANTAAR